MKKTPQSLPDDIETLKRMLLERDKRIAKLERVNQQLSDKLQQLLEHYNLKKYQKFSPSSETYEGEGEVLNEACESVTKDSLLGAAITYSQKQWPKLMRYLDDGRLNIDYNRAERAVKPFVIGRKAWLFANTKAGAQASAALYSLVETAKINGLEPFDYLCRLLAELPKANTHEQLQQLPPY